MSAPALLGTQLAVNQSPDFGSGMTVLLLICAALAAIGLRKVGAPWSISLLSAFSGFSLGQAIVAYGSGGPSPPVFLYGGLSLSAFALMMWLIVKKGR